MAVCIGFSVNKIVEAAVVFNPILDEFYSARRGKGAFMNEKKLKVNDVSNLNEALVLTGYAGVPIRFDFSPLHPFSYIASMINININTNYSVLKFRP